MMRRRRSRGEDDDDDKPIFRLFNDKKTHNKKFKKKFYLFTPEFHCR